MNGRKALLGEQMLLCHFIGVIRMVTCMGIGWAAQKSASLLGYNSQMVIIWRSIKFWVSEVLHMPVVPVEAIAD